MATNRRRTDEQLTNDVQRPSVDRDDISRRAYERYEERGREPGHDVDDWLEAERDVQHQFGER
jgi:hypothetical protein